MLARTGREEAAVAMLERVSAVPDDANVRRALGQAHALLGLRHLREGQREGFVAEMQRAVDIDPDNGQAHYNLALDALQRGQTGKARDHARAALRARYAFPPGFSEALGLQAGAVQEPGSPPGS